MNTKKNIVQDPLFTIIGECSDQLQMQAFVIGGWVRDSILKRKNLIKEFDIVSSKDGIELAKKVANRLKVNKISIYKTFGTAAIQYKNTKIEFNGARKESYQPSSRNPKVIRGSIEDDQKRRDFTINAMAVSLNKENFGEFIDPFNGMLDLQNKTIKTPLEPNKTYSDDPLRMMRAIRFATTLEFNIDKESLNAITVSYTHLTLPTKRIV